MAAQQPVRSSSGSALVSPEFGTTDPVISLHSGFGLATGPSSSIRDDTTSNNGAEQYDDNPALRNMECVICYEPFVRACRINCGHLFCRLCIKQWIRNNPESANCPLCRRQITKIQQSTGTDTKLIAFFATQSQQRQRQRKELVAAIAEEEKRYDNAAGATERVRFARLYGGARGVGELRQRQTRPLQDLPIFDVGLHFINSSLLRQPFTTFYAPISANSYQAQANNYAAQLQQQQRQYYMAHQLQQSMDQVPMPIAAYPSGSIPVPFPSVPLSYVPLYFSYPSITYYTYFL